MENYEFTDENGRCELAMMDHTGDTKKIWNPQNQDEVDDARASFDRLRKKGHLAFKVNQAGDKGEQITEFDPHAGKIIMSPPLVGG